MVNLDKLDRMALLALDNALRLHFDAVALYRQQKHPSAFLLSVLSQEEIGKAHMISDFVWRSWEHRFEEKEEEEFLGLLYKHPLKQGAFLRNSDRGMKLLTTESGRKIYEDVFNGALEAKKQEAAYVGLRKEKGKIDIKGKVNCPIKISRAATEKQISHIHDYLVDTCAGVIADQYELDISDIKRIYNRRLYKQLRSRWPISRRTEKWIHKLEVFLRENHQKLL